MGVPGVDLGVDLARHGGRRGSRVEIASRRGSTGPYERIAGKIYFLIDPANKRNQVITDLDKAPKNAAGKIELSADLVILRTRDASKGNGIAIRSIRDKKRSAHKYVLLGSQKSQTSPSCNQGLSWSGAMRILGSLERRSSVCIKALANNLFNPVRYRS